MGVGELWRVRRAKGPGGSGAPRRWGQRSRDSRASKERRRWGSGNWGAFDVPRGPERLGRSGEMGSMSRSCGARRRAGWGSGAPRSRGRGRATVGLRGRQRWGKGSCGASDARLTCAAIRTRGRTAIPLGTVPRPPSAPASLLRPRHATHPALPEAPRPPPPRRATAAPEARPAATPPRDGGAARRSRRVCRRRTGKAPSHGKSRGLHSRGTHARDEREFPTV